MKKVKINLKYIITLIMVLLLILSSCGAMENEQSQQNSSDYRQQQKEFNTGEANIDISKRVNITGYLLGFAPMGMPDVMDELNKKLIKDINATMEVYYISWTDLQSKYPLILATGEDVDWVFTANWCSYSQEAAIGAFKEITFDMLQKYMPRHYGMLKKTTAFNEVKINGKMYMVPTSTPDRKVPVTLIRGDLRKKYNISEIKRFSDIEPYLAAIKNNEPGMIPMNLDSTYDIGRPFGEIVNEMGPIYMDILVLTGTGSTIVYQFEDPTGKIGLITEDPALPAHKKAAAVLKNWYAKGYINKNAFANKVRSKESFEQGKSAVGFGNSIDTQGNIANSQAKSYEVEIIPSLSGDTGHNRADPYMGNGFSIASRSKNVERTLMAMDLIMEDEAYNYLVYFGVEGKNYVVRDGMIDLPEGLTADKNTYPPDVAGFWFTNKDQFKPLASWNDSYIKLKENLKGMLAPDIYASFAPATDSVKTEVATVNQVTTQYYIPIQVGTAKDVDGAFKTLNDKLMAAGIQKLLDEMRKQTQAFLKAQK